MNAIIRNTKKLAFALVVLGSIAFAHVAAAAKIELDVWTSRYGYVVVKPGSNTGGAIRWDGSQYYTDRVNRGERVYIFVTPSPGESTAAQATWYGVWCDSQSRFLTGPVAAPWYGWCWYEEYVVPLDPNKDNLYVDIYSNVGSNNQGFSTKRIPIGYRKP